MKSSSQKDHKFKEVKSEKNATAKWTSTHLLDKDVLIFCCNVNVGLKSSLRFWYSDLKQLFLKAYILTRFCSY